MLPAENFELEMHEVLLSRHIGRFFRRSVRSKEETDKRSAGGPVGGSGGMLPREILKIWLSETVFRTF